MKSASLWPVGEVTTGIEGISFGTRSVVVRLLGRRGVSINSPPTRVAGHYLAAEGANVAVVSNEATLEANSELGLENCKL